MAISDRNIVITPNVSATGPAQPKIVFTGADSSTGDSAAITLFANPENSGTLSFSASEGQLFSISNNLTSGDIFTVNDVSGIPSLAINANGVISLAEFNGRVLVGGAVDDSSSALQVSGTVAATSYTGDGSLLTGITSSGGGGAVNDLFLKYRKVIDSNYTVDSDGLGRGVTAFTGVNDSDGLTIATGVTITVNSGSAWVLSSGDKNMGLDAMVATSNQTERTMRTGTIKPTLDNTYDLGDSAIGWRNIYTNDLNLSNMNSSGNDIDGTTGKWTIQEGEDQLYVINKRNGKKYKFMLEEIV
jgi:hypothetical protein